MQSLHILEQVVDHDGAEHELPGRGQWLLSYVPGAGKRKRMLYAVAGEWYLPPPFGWCEEVVVARASTLQALPHPLAMLAGPR